MAGDINQNLNLRLTADTSSLDRSIQDSMANMKFSAPSDTPSMVQPPYAYNNQNNPSDFQNLQAAVDIENRLKDSQSKENDIIKNVTDSFSNLINALNKTIQAHDQLSSKYKESEQNVVRQKTQTQQAEDRKDKIQNQQLMTMLNGGASSVGYLARGDVGGGLLSMGNSMTNVMNSGAQMAELSGDPAVAAMLGKAILPLAAVLAVGKGAKTLTDKYKNAMPTIDDTGALFTEFSSDSARNSSKSLVAYKQLNEYSADTRLDIHEFNKFAQEMVKSSGVKDIDIIGKAAQTAAQFAAGTGGDYRQYGNLASTILRYEKGANVDDIFRYSYGANKASGRENGEFGTFLTGLQRVMEDGIANGFTRSSKDVAETMTMYSKLSGNSELWSGDNLVKKMGQINSSFVQTTSLSSSADMIAYNAINGLYSDPSKLKGELDKNNSNTYVEGGDYVNVLAMMERGIDSSNFKAIFNNLNSVYGDDIAAEIEAIRQMTGLNYAGANQLYNMSLQDYDPNTLDSEIKKLQGKAENQTNETKYINAMNKLSEAMETAGSGMFKLESDALDSISGNVKAITDFLIKPAKADIEGGLIQLGFRKGTQQFSRAKKIIEDNGLDIDSLLANSTDTADFQKNSFNLLDLYKLNTNKKWTQQEFQTVINQRSNIGTSDPTKKQINLGKLNTEDENRTWLLQDRNVISQIQQFAAANELKTEDLWETLLYSPSYGSAAKLPALLTKITTAVSEKTDRKGNVKRAGQAEGEVTTEEYGELQKLLGQILEEIKAGIVSKS